MATYTVTRVRKEFSEDRTHELIEGVCTSDRVHHTGKQVVDSIEAGNTWQSSPDGYVGKIEVLRYCPKSACYATPYIKTKPDSAKKDNLENLDRC